MNNKFMKTQTELKQLIESTITESFSLNGDEFDVSFFDISGKQSVEITQWSDSGKSSRISLTEQNLKDILRKALKFKKMIKNAKKD
jgi:hypothetical protein